MCSLLSANLQFKNHEEARSWFLKFQNQFKNLLYTSVEQDQFATQLTAVKTLLKTVLIEEVNPS